MQKERNDFSFNFRDLDYKAKIYKVLQIILTFDLLNSMVLHQERDDVSRKFVKLQCCMSEAESSAGGWL